MWIIRISREYEFAVANLPNMRHSVALCRKALRLTADAFDSDGAATRRSAVDMLNTENNSAIQSGGAFTGASQNFSYLIYHQQSALERRPKNKSSSLLPFEILPDAKYLARYIHQ